jgi:hypothetical protein
MPKQNKNSKGRQQKSEAVTVQTDNDFDDMLAEVCAVDVASPLAVDSITTTTTTTTTNPPSSSSSSSSSSSTYPSPAARTTRSRVEARETVSEATIVQACSLGDMSLLQRWARRGVRVMSAEPLLTAAGCGKLDAVRLLLQELGADASLLHNGFTALCVAA